MGSLLGEGKELRGKTLAAGANRQRRMEFNGIPAGKASESRMFGQLPAAGSRICGADKVCVPGGPGRNAEKRVQSLHSLQSAVIGACCCGM
jgi:hypothetical protein